MSQLQQDIAEFGSLNVLRTSALSELEAISRYRTLLKKKKFHLSRGSPPLPFTFSQCPAYSPTLIPEKLISISRNTTDI